MKRLNFIYLAAPLLLAYNAVPPFFSPVWRTVTAAGIGLGLWAVLWLRLYGSKRLRPEFSVLGILPNAYAYGLHLLQQTDAAAAAPFYAPFWQNLYFVMYLGFCRVGIAALLPDDRTVKGWKDPVTIFMSIVLILYTFTHWAASSFSLFLPPQS